MYVYVYKFALSFTKFMFMVVLVEKSRDHCLINLFFLLFFLFILEGRGGVLTNFFIDWQGIF